MLLVCIFLIDFSLWLIFHCKPGNDGIRSLAIKFLEMIILLYTPDPNGPSQPTSFELNDGKETFNPNYSFIMEIWQT